MPFSVRDRLDQFADGLEDIGNDFFIPSDAESNGIFEHDRQELGGGGGTVDWFVETGFEEVGDSTDVIDVDVRQQKGIDAVEREVDFWGFSPFFGVAALKGSAIDKNGMVGVEVDLVAGTRDTEVAAVMRDLHGRASLGEV